MRQSQLCIKERFVLIAVDEMKKNMYNHRKIKSCSFLRDALYPERLLSRHKHDKKSRRYALLKAALTPALTSSRISREETVPSDVVEERRALNTLKESSILLEGISHLYRDGSVNRQIQDLQRKPVSIEGQMRNSSSRDIQIDALTHKRTKIQRENWDQQTQAQLAQRKSRVGERGLQEMETHSFTNGLLRVGHRYFRI